MVSQISPKPWKWTGNLTRGLAQLSMLYKEIGRASGICGVLAREKDYEQQNDGTGGIGGGVSCRGGGRDGVGWRYGCGGSENAGGSGAGAASYRAQGH